MPDITGCPAVADRRTVSASLTSTPGATVRLVRQCELGRHLVSFEPHISYWFGSISRDTLNGMRRPHRKQVRHYDEPGHVQELTFSCYRRLPLLNDDLHRRLFCEACRRAVIRHHYRLFAFVVMPEHVYLIVQPRGQMVPLPKTPRKSAGTR